MMRITDKEYKIDDRNEFQYSIETGISDIESGKEKYLVLTPSKPVCGTAYLKLSLGKAILPGTFILEAGKEDTDTKVEKISGDDAECIKLFTDFFEGWGIKTDDWNKVY
ncbi:MAG: hypothetical protein IKN07_06715 [Lachnospiraceae bacterium]|nr:hypothetical protein [Lachnospiraceae bacterium]